MVRPTVLSARERLTTGIETWLKRDPGTHQLEILRNQRLGKERAIENGFIPGDKPLEVTRQLGILAEEARDANNERDNQLALAQAQKEERNLQQATIELARPPRNAYPFGVTSS